MNLGENIKNAFEVVQNTYSNIDKLMKFCDSIAVDNGYDAVTPKFLRYKSDSDYEGWLINSFIKLYQTKTDIVLENDWKDGPIFVMELNFQDKPTVYLSKFEYDDISEWSKGVSPTDYWGFSEPIDCEGSDFKEKCLNSNDEYYVSEPETENVKNKYWGVRRVIYKTFDLLQLDSKNISERVFGEFDKLKNF